MSVSGGTFTYSYQDAVTMGTDCSTKPLTGLELNLSVHIIYKEISITWKRKKGEKHVPIRFPGCWNEPHFDRKDEKSVQEFWRPQSFYEGAFCTFLSCVRVCSDERPLQDDTGERVWLGAHVPKFKFLFYFSRRSSLLSKNQFPFNKKVTTPHSASLKSRYRPQGESCLPSWSTCTWHVFCYSRLLCVATTWRACWVNERLGSVYKHTASPEPSHGKSKTSEGKGGLKYLLLLLM